MLSTLSDRTKSVVLFGVLVIITSTSTQLLGQAGSGGYKNNPFSPSPGHTSRTDERQASTASENPIPNAADQVRLLASTAEIPIRPAIARNVFKRVPNAEKRATQPSEIYRIASGDLLYVNLKNSANGSGYYTVRPDGTIDYPLAGETVAVNDLTVRDVEEMLISGITLFSDPQIEVKVHEFASHTVIVSGHAENTGEKHLQREAIPLYVIRAEALVDARATRVNIKRTSTSVIETFALNDASTDNVLIYPGNSIEFAGDNGLNSADAHSYYISGTITAAGQKPLTTALTLYQAVVAAGGTSDKVKKALIRRKEKAGTLSIREYNLRSIRDGKAPDPILVNGDVVEIKK